MTVCSVRISALWSYTSALPRRLRILPCTVDLARTALADEGGHVVVPEAVTDGEWHLALQSRKLSILASADSSDRQSHSTCFS